MTAQVKEAYLNNVNHEIPELNKEEIGFLGKLENILEKAAHEGKLNEKEAEYFFFHPLSGCNWIRDNMGVELL